MSIRILLLVNVLGLVFLFPHLTQTTVAQMNISSESVGDSFNNETSPNATDSSFATEQFSLEAEMKPHSNQFMPEGYWEIKEFDFVPTDGSELCPLNNCEYSVENGQFSTNTYTGGYALEGRLKVTTQEGDVKKSKFYDFNVGLDKTSEEERGGEILQFLEGTFGFGKNTYNPEISYDITNATLKVDEKNPVLIIQGERSPF